jgi:thermosome
MGNNQQIIILKEGTERSRNKDAQFNNIAAARAVADAVRSTLGPKGMDKMLVDSMGDVVITNDGVTILKEIDVQHPAAKMVVEVAKTQDMECGDGTTSSVIIAGELLKKAEALIESNIHPTIIANGYKMAAAEAIKILDTIAIPVTPSDVDVLKKVALTAMTGKSVGGQREFLSELAVKAIKSVADKVDGKWTVDVDNIKVEKKTGGSIADTDTIEGIVIDKERVHPRMAKVVKDAKIVLLTAALEIKKTEVEAKIQIRDPSSMQRFLDEEENTLKAMVDKIKSSGANVVFCQKGIDDLAQHFLAKASIYTVRRVKKSDMEKLGRATGGRVVTSIHDLTKNDLGKAGVVEERKIGDEKMTFVVECENPKSVSIILRGGTEHVVDELSRAMEDALRVVGVVVEDKQIVPGGGAPEVELALRLREYAATVGGREQLAIEAFADSMEVIPKTLAENAGLDQIDSLVSLRSQHEKGIKSAGLDMDTGEPVDMLKLGVVEPLRVKTQAINSATEAAVMILRIDDVIASKSGGSGGMPGGMGGMPPGMGGMGGMGEE